ncbi:MAG: hypothetical protein K8S13_22425 [Desulfobacula sp.]|uniref:hypothetical protein n=1 Tax=Desulfobacula sp. TaxID=2593537 RepID=UPI0025BDE309|nr:hypothetical protein [Desulfobacula sp.]MCD4722587.1 hypothetical protein [Desulfobacula sp.]
MKKIINPIKYTQRLIFFSLFFIITLTSMSFAQDSENIAGQDLVISANILFVAANVNSERMSISYNGLSIGSGYLFQSDKHLYGFESSEPSEADFKEFDEDDYPFKLGRKLKQMTHYFLRFFNVDDFSNNDSDSKFLLKSKVDTDQMNPNKMNLNDFEFNLSLNIGYDDDAILKMNAIKLESYWLHTYVNAVYHYEKNEFELGLSCAYINDCFLDGMKLEFQANPIAGTGAILLTMNL